MHCSLLKNTVCRSLGVCFWELSTGKQPFQAADTPTLHAQIKEGALPSLPAGTTPEWGALLKGMLAVEAGSRASVDDLLSQSCMLPAVKAAVARSQEVCAFAPPLGRLLTIAPVQGLPPPFHTGMTQWPAFLTRDTEYRHVMAAPNLSSTVWHTTPEQCDQI